MLAGPLEIQGVYISFGCIEETRKRKADHAGLNIYSTVVRG